MSVALPVLRSRLSRYLAVVLIGLFVAGCSSGDIFVRVIPPIPPTDAWPPQRLILEVGNKAWEIEAGNGGGVVALSDATTPQPVRLVQSTDCQILYTFDALVGHKYTLKASSDGALALLDETEGAYEYGPALAETRRGCGQ